MTVDAERMLPSSKYSLVRVHWRSKVNDKRTNDGVDDMRVAAHQSYGVLGRMLCHLQYFSPADKS